MNKKTSVIIQAGLLAGTLDILAAIVYVYIRTSKLVIGNIFRFIASGFFGKESFTGGRRMILAGVFFHYLIAFSFTIFFFWIYPKIKWLSANKIFTGIVYGLFIWAIMNLVVVPHSNTSQRPFNLSSMLINMGILILMIGIPLSYLAHRFYGKNSFA